MMNKKIIKIRDDFFVFLIEFCKIDGYVYKIKDVFVFFGENFILFLVFKL